MLSIAEALLCADRLDSVSDTARLDCEILLAKAVERDRTYLYTWPERTLTDVQQQQFLHNLEQREQGVPVAYILGEREFWSLVLSVNSSTLIPRPETELLVETALDIFSEDITAPNLMPTPIPRKIIDLGTGTGAIALALASEKPHWQLWGVDASAGACELAMENRDRYQLDNVVIQQGSWLDRCEAYGVEPDSLDMIISNPPYIDEDDPHLSQGDVRFEPKSALVAPKHGLADIEYITSQAVGVLKSGGWLLFEHGYQQAEAVMQLLLDAGFVDGRTIHDMAGHGRVTLGRRP